MIRERYPTGRTGDSCWISRHAKKISVASWNTTALFGVVTDESWQNLKKRGRKARRLIDMNEVSMFQEVHVRKE